MARYRITCTGLPEDRRGHQHAESVGVGKDATSAGVKWSMEAVRDALDVGHRFYTVDTAGVHGDLVPFDCSCGARTIAPSAGPGPDPPLLPVCIWAA